MQNYADAQICDIDHYLINIFIISLYVINESFNIFVLVFKSSCKIGTFHAWSNGASNYFICLTYILVRSD